MGAFLLRAERLCLLKLEVFVLYVEKECPGEDEFINFYPEPEVAACKALGERVGAGVLPSLRQARSLQMRNFPVCCCFWRAAAHTPLPACSCLLTKFCMPQVVLHYDSMSSFNDEEQWIRPQCEISPSVEVIPRLRREDCNGVWSELHCYLREPKPWSALSSAAQRAFTSLDLGPLVVRMSG